MPWPTRELHGNPVLITLNLASDAIIHGRAAAAAGRHRELIQAAIAAGVRLIDTAPMYGAAERLLADALDGQRGQVLIAGKIWTPSPQEGQAQLARAVDWYGGRVDLMQIHTW